MNNEAGAKAVEYIEMFEGYPDIVTVSQLRKMLSIGRNTAYKLLETGELKSKKIGKKYIIPKVYVKEFLLKNR